MVNFYSYTTEIISSFSVFNSDVNFSVVCD